MSGGLYVASGGNLQHSEAEDLDRKLREGDGIFWKGDPRLYLAVGIIEETKRGVKTGRVARRYEVYREMEDGRTEMIGHWRMDEFWRIIHDVVQMRAGFEGRGPTAVEIIDKNNAKIEKDNSDQFRDVYGEMLDHGARVALSLEHEHPTTYQVGGLRDEKPEDDAPVD